MKRASELRGASRRDFISSVITASAALGLGPTRALEMLQEMGGSAMAQSAIVKNRTVNIVGGTGAHAWFTMLWPAPKVISTFNSAFAYDDPAKAVKSTSAALGGRSLYTRMSAGGKALWSTYGDSKLVTAMVCGNSSAHSIAATNTLSIPDGVGGAVGLYAGQAAIQSTLKALVPVIGIKFGGTDMPYGNAPGKPNAASVANASAMVGLFSSAASRLANRLSMPANQATFGLYHKAFLGLTRTANAVTYSRALGDSRVAVDLLAQNLGNQLKPAANQVQQWCAGPGQSPVNPQKQSISDLAEALIVTANAFKLGLTAQVNIPFANDDPHGAFADPAAAGMTANQMANIFESFMAELAKSNDPSPDAAGKKLSDTVVMTFSGDTPKEPFVASGWPDSTPSGRNWIYVMSQGRLKPGWFGDLSPGKATDFDPATGSLVTGTIPGNTILDGALGGIIFATTGGDDRAVRDIVANANFMGISNPILTG